MPQDRNTLAALHDLTGRGAVVTGGSRGIGRAIAQRLAEAGADVVVASRKLDACEAAAAEIASSTGRRTAGFACHVGRWSDCDVAPTTDAVTAIGLGQESSGTASAADAGGGTTMRCGLAAKARSAIACADNA